MVGTRGKHAAHKCGAKNNMEGRRPMGKPRKRWLDLKNLGVWNWRSRALYRRGWRGDQGSKAMEAVSQPERNKIKKHFVWNRSAMCTPGNYTTYNDDKSLNNYNLLKVNSTDRWPCFWGRLVWGLCCAGHWVSAALQVSTTYIQYRFSLIFDMRFVFLNYLGKYIWSSLIISFQIW